MGRNRELPTTEELRRLDGHLEKILDGARLDAVENPDGEAEWRLLLPERVQFEGFARASSHVLEDALETVRALREVNLIATHYSHPEPSE